MTTTSLVALAEAAITTIRTGATDARVSTAEMEYPEMLAAQMLAEPQLRIAVQAEAAVPMQRAIALQDRAADAVGLCESSSPAHFPPMRIPLVRVERRDRLVREQREQPEELAGQEESRLLHSFSSSPLGQ